jgi:hypothetical protein
MDSFDVASYRLGDGPSGGVIPTLPLKTVEGETLAAPADEARSVIAERRGVDADAVQVELMTMAAYRGSVQNQGEAACGPADGGTSGCGCQAAVPPS